MLPRGNSPNWSVDGSWKLPRGDFGKSGTKSEIESRSIRITQNFDLKVPGKFMDMLYTCRYKMCSPAENVTFWCRPNLWKLPRGDFGKRVTKSEIESRSVFLPQIRHLKVPGKFMNLCHTRRVGCHAALKTVSCTVKHTLLYTLYQKVHLRFFERRNRKKRVRGPGNIVFHPKNAK